MESYYLSSPTRRDVARAPSVKRLPFVTRQTPKHWRDLSLEE